MINSAFDKWTIRTLLFLEAAGKLLYNLNLFEKVT